MNFIHILLILLLSFNLSTDLKKAGHDGVVCLSHCTLPTQPDILRSFEGLLSGQIMTKTLPRVDLEDFHASLHPSTTVQSPDEKLAEENTEHFLGVPSFPRALRGQFLTAFTSGRLSALQKSLMSVFSPHSSLLSALFLWDFLFLILGCKLHEGRSLSNPLVMSLGLQESRGR